MVSGQRTRIFSYDIQLRSELSHSVSLELVVYLVSSQFSEFQVRRRHVMAQEPPRPVGPRGEEKARPSVRLSPFFNSSVRHACYSSINVMLEMPFTVVFIVSSSVQSIPNAARAKGQTSPLIALIAIGTAIMKQLPH